MKKQITIKDFEGLLVWSYTRVSSKEQFQNNGSIETQVKRIKSFASDNNLIISKEFDAEYESSKKINTQKTLKELLDAIKKTHHSKKPRIILIWSPSRFGRAGAEHIELFVSLRRKYGVYLYSVSSEHNTFTDRNENEFSTQLLYAQRENFSRQDVIIPGMINALEKGTFLGKTPRGYDHFGPRVVDPQKVQAFQEIKLNSDGHLLKEAFRLKIYEAYTNKEIQDYLSQRGLHIPKQTISVMWLKLFYTGHFTNSLVENKIIKGHWEPIISIKEYDLLQKILSGSVQQGIPKMNGKIATPLIPKFLVCDDCNRNMTSYHNKRKGIYYYKCPSCNKTINATTKQTSLNEGVHQHFQKVLESLSFSKEFHPLFSKQLEKIIDFEFSNYADRQRILKTEVNQFQEKFDTMEYRFAINEISKEIFDKHGSNLKKKIQEKNDIIAKAPTKMSNHKKFINNFLKMAENPYQYWDKLNYNEKRTYQNILFPDGLRFSLKNKECRTPKMNLMLELTNCYSDCYTNKKEKTQKLKAFESRLVAGTGLEPVTFGL
jgi:site-specific DNA recombinase